MSDGKEHMVRQDDKVPKKINQWFFVVQWSEHYGCVDMNMKKNLAVFPVIDGWSVQSVPMIPLFRRVDRSWEPDGKTKERRPDQGPDLRQVRAPHPSQRMELGIHHPPSARFPGDQILNWKVTTQVVWDLDLACEYKKFRFCLFCIDWYSCVAYQCMYITLITGRGNLDAIPRALSRHNFLCMGRGQWIFFRAVFVWLPKRHILEDPPKCFDHDRPFAMTQAPHRVGFRNRYPDTPRNFVLVYTPRVGVVGGIRKRQMKYFKKWSSESYVFVESISCRFSCSLL